MRNSLWLALLAVSISCASNTPSSTSLEYLRCPTGAVGTGTPDTGASSSDNSLFGSMATSNPNNCISNPSICGSLGTNFSCDAKQGCCTEAILDRCNKVSDCTMANSAFCDLNTNHCVACSTATDTTIGDKQCKDWASTQLNNMGKVLCSAGSCVECRSNSDCMAISTTKTVCDPADNTCKGCTKNNDCASQICKLDSSLLTANEPVANLGTCALPTDVAFVDNLPANCDNAGAGGKPYCQVTQAVTTGKPYIKVQGNGGTTANLYMPVTVSGAGKQFIIIGPGRDTPFATSQAVIGGIMVTGGAQLTLIGISATNSTGPAVQCSSSSTLNVYNVLISDAVAIPKGGIYTTACSKVVVEKTKITGATGNGLFITGGTNHRVVNNSIINGVGTATEPAGLKISGGADGLFAFNTIAGNRQGVQCDNAVTITDSIVTANTATPQVSTTCQQTRVVTDQTQVMLDPMYSSGGDPKLTAAQVNDMYCVDKGMPDPGMTIKDDYLSIKRPIGKGYDIGAFEVR